MVNGLPEGTIQIKPQPKEVIDVDPVIIMRMKAILRGEDLNDLYTDNSRTFNQFLLQKEKNKLKKIFGSPSQICEAYSSIQNMKTIHNEMLFEGVERQMLYEHSYNLAGDQNCDEVDFYKHFLFNDKLITKEERIEQKKNVLSFNFLLKDYQTRHFDILKISKEAIDMDPYLFKLFKERKLIPVFDNYIKHFYGEKVI